MLRKKNILSASLLYLLFSVSLVHALSWDENNPDEMGPGSSETIFIVGNCPPYTWEVEGEGFSVGSSVTQEESNTLISDADSCGSATITVVDSCGGRIEGHALRSTEGNWTFVCSGDDSGWSSCWPNPYGNSSWKWVWDERGKYRYHLGLGCHYRPYECLFSSCEGHTAYIPPDWQGKMCYGACQGRPQCDDNGYIGCCYGQVKLRVYEWKCPDIDLELPPGAENDDCKSEISE